MAVYTERTVDVQLEVYVTTNGGGSSTFSRATGTRRLEVLKDGVVIAKGDPIQIQMTLAQVKTQVAALT